MTVAELIQNFQEHNLSLDGNWYPKDTGSKIKILRVYNYVTETNNHKAMIEKIYSNMPSIPENGKDAYEEWKVEFVSASNAIEADVRARLLKEELDYKDEVEQVASTKAEKRKGNKVGQESKNSVEKKVNNVNVKDSTKKSSLLVYGVRDRLYTLAKVKKDKINNDNSLKCYFKSTKETLV
jgi:hypothetical protein